MTKNEIQTFAKNYSEKDFDRIKFDWNGKYGDDFEDKNYDFRMQLCEIIKEDFSYSSEKLILDLYLELSKCAKETFGVYNSFHLFANELLERTGIKYFDEYIEGASKSMDTGLSSGHLDLSNKRINEILSHIKSKMANSKNESEIGKYDYMLKRFEWLSEKDKKEAFKPKENSIGIDLNGRWEGIITLGKEYKENEGKEIFYESELSQLNNKIKGLSFDISGFGINPEPADINGKIEGLRISFTKQYRISHSVTNTDKAKIDTTRKGPKIQYVGFFNNSTNSFKGNWTISVARKFLGLIPLNIKTTGTWNMKRK
ncbi:hypothetical protein LXD69_00170 [Flavobacterium sediminilitoris]|uniref:Uncharacterized protein n=1 Tax=Flavobacterium sediminilitoris TaxID=2024526 RepID=A0ABY4HNX1_9FLAO|nr:MULTISPECIES: hypothetical protein [Flavobacterium]UOX33946.1 hypothetical protein LXD69_00170 [Flavobacterium sediminilitoris]